MRTRRISDPAFGLLPFSGAGVPSLQELPMDFAVLAITALFFALALAYVALCEKL
ncbi:hypothetical protein [Devosia sp. A16]|uniref:hypothetical protein n=1 Tax=Devosia sp. A16 TaxID=1736675 RepID=UPI000AD0AD89|nr:hypothetical protein [Devosia sp. A16]